MAFSEWDMSASQSIWHFNELPGVACVAVDVAVASRAEFININASACWPTNRTANRIRYDKTGLAHFDLRQTQMPIAGHL